ncbi:FtsQ-type POTRA domain-containing protein [Pseudomonadota bacterium]|nr:FtsQ-type POTRA domain-containing protein [Pseudomonadota bacterium]
MLKSIFKNNKIYENNVNRNTIGKHPKIQLIILCLVLVLFSVIFNFYNSNKYNSKLKNIIENTNTLLINYGFYLQNIYISGNNNLQREDILSIINDKEYKTIFDINLFKIRNNLLLNEWIETVKIERTLPSSIKIQIIEKKPVAIWQTKSGNKLITKDGGIISNANITAFKNSLPIIIGKGANKDAFLILQILKKNPDLYNHVWSLSYINKRRWNVHLNHGVIVLLPRTKIYDAWSKISFLQKKYKILDIGLTEIDIRNKNQIFAKINFNKKLYLKRKKL